MEKLTRPADVPTVADAFQEFADASQMASVGPVPGVKPKNMTPAQREKALAWALADPEAQTRRAITAAGKLGEAIAWERELAFWDAWLSLP